MGYEDITRNYRIWIPEEKQIEISRDVEFREIAVPEVLIDLSQGEQEPDAMLEEKLQEERIQEENQEKQLEQPTSTYQLRNRGKIKAPQKFTYLCQRTPIESYLTHT